MPYDKFLIAPYNSGLVKDLPTWMTPEDSFKVLKNAAVQRGRLKKRFGGKPIGGSLLASSLSYLLGSTDASGNLSGTLPGNIYDTVGQFFSVGDQIFTVQATGTPVTMLKSSGSGSGTLDTTTGAYSFTGVTASSSVYWYPTLPVTGITHYEKGEISEHVAYAFDRQFVYKYSGSRWVNDTSFTGTFNGGNNDFFWATNYIGVSSDQIALFISNYNVTESGTPASTDDPMYYFNGTTWANFSSVTVFNSSGDFVASAKIIINWKNRLLLINTVEQSGGSNTHFQSRVRYSHNGSPLSGNAWLERRETYSGNTADGAGYIDLPVEESIVSVAVVKDRLLVFAERSTWELAYTGNAAVPFFWRGIGSIAGSLGRFSTVRMEDSAVTVSQSGIIATNGAAVTRIDEKVPDLNELIDRDVDSAVRLHSVVDHRNSFIYWVFTDDTSSYDFNNKVLAYNYNNSSWSLFDDVITCFGFFEQSNDKTWDTSDTWDTDDSWGTYYEKGDSKAVIAGNHKGVLFILDNEYPQNAPSLPVANVSISGDVATLTITDHNLTDGSYIEFVDSNITFSSDGIFKVKVVDSDTISITDSSFSGTYLGGGYCKLVSVIEAQTKEFNPYIKTGDSIYLPKVSFCVINTTDGELFIDYEVDNTDYVLSSLATDSGAALGTSVLEMHAYDGYPFEKIKKRLWRDVYIQAKGDSVSLIITLKEDQILNKSVVYSNMEIQGILLYSMRV